MANAWLRKRSWRCWCCWQKGVALVVLVASRANKEDTIIQWLEGAVAHAGEVEAALLAKYQIIRGQLDGLWGQQGRKKGYPEPPESGQFGRSTMIDMDTRLRVARGIAKTETEASMAVFRTLKERGHPDAPPPTISDGWGGIDEAMIEVYGRVPKYRGVGRPPERKRPLPGWQYVQMVKIRRKGRVVGTKLRVIYGEAQTTLELLGKSTAYVERTHATMRTFSSRLTRRTLAFSKQLRLCRAAAAWDDCYYNWARAHKSLRLECVNVPPRHWQPRSPAMVAGLTDHIWTVKELLTTVVPPCLNNTQ